MTLNKRARLKVLDTFAGAGGFSLGFQLAGCEVIGAIEQDSWAAETFQFNHPAAKVLVGDIGTFSNSRIKANFGENPPDIVLGGPPCQGFSICRKNAGDPTDPRNTLFQEFLRVGKALNPAILVLENVPNLANAHTEDGHSVLEIIKGELAALGYNTYSAVLEAIHFGVPQIRKRLFVIGSRTPLERAFPDATHAAPGVGQGGLFDGHLELCPTLWEAISDLPKLEAGEGEEWQEYEDEPRNEYQRFMRNRAKRLANHEAMHHSKRMVARFASMSWGESQSDVPMHLRPLKRNGGGTISSTVYDQNNRRMHPEKPCHTVAASFYANFVHPYQHRNFTPREGARIQSFPDWYVFRGKPTVVSHRLLEREGRHEERHLCQYNQIGNAVPPLLARAIAGNLMRQSPFANEPLCSRR